MYDVASKIAAIAISANFFILATFLKKVIGTSYHPAVIFAFTWGCFTLVPAVLLYAVPINPFSILYIFACAVSFAATPLLMGRGAAHFNFSDNYIARKKFIKSLDSKFLVLILLSLCALGILFCFLTMMANGWSLTDIFFDLLATSGRFAALRGNEGMEYGLLGSFGVLFTYAAASLGGLLYSVQKTRIERIVIALLGMVPSVLVMVVQSSKLIFLIAFSFFVSGVFLANTYRSKPLRINIKNTVTIIKVGLVFLPFVLVSFISREHFGDLDDVALTLQALNHAIASYALGQIYAFSDFFSFYVGMDSVSSYGNESYRLGAYTFSSIIEIFGVVVEFPPGLYLETGKYKDLFETNIFTIFRGVILDFGIPGSLIAFALLGCLSNFIFSGVVRAKNNLFSNVAYMHIIVFIFISYLISVFMARYMYANFALISIVLAANGLMMKVDLRRRDVPA